MPPAPRQQVASAADPPDWSLEAELWSRGITPVAGVDEAGRGALAGPVVAAAVILAAGRHPYRDSKTLLPERREELARQIRAEALAWGVGTAEPAEIDAFNVLRATHLAAARALEQLRLRLAPAGLVTDYLWLDVDAEVLAVPRADSRSFQAAAAGVLAKVERDALMADLAHVHPGYGFERNKGYGAPAHLSALDAIGPCTVHRMSFRPLRAATATGETVLTVAEEPAPRGARAG